MGEFAYLLADLVRGIAGFIEMFLFIYIVLSLLISFNVINGYNKFVSVVYGSLHKLFEPIMRPIKNILPDLNGLDFSPIIVFFALKYGTPFITLTIEKLA